MWQKTFFHAHNP